MGADESGRGLSGTRCVFVLRGFCWASIEPVVVGRASIIVACPEMQTLPSAAQTPDGVAHTNLRLRGWHVWFKLRSPVLVGFPYSLASFVIQSLLSATWLAARFHPLVLPGLCHFPGICIVIEIRIQGVLQLLLRVRIFDRDQ